MVIVYSAYTIRTVYSWHVNEFDCIYQSFVQHLRKVVGFEDIIWPLKGEFFVLSSIRGFIYTEMIVIVLQNIAGRNYDDIST